MDKRLERILPRVQKPARYTGGEYNQIIKDKSGVRLRVALCFPDTYEIGMSNLGMRIIYGVLNAMPGVWCERVFAPWLDMEREMRAAGAPLCALESGDPLADFDVIAFSVGYEMAYTNMLNMLDLAGIPIHAAERPNLRPLVAAGGTSCCNGEPMSDFIDLFLLGEGEELDPEVMALYLTALDEGWEKGEFLKRAAGIQGVYVPSLYDVSYNPDGTVAALSPRGGAPAVVKKRIVEDFEHSYYPTAPVVPSTEVVHDRVNLELFRGCVRGCRFCQAGHIYRPVRSRSPELLTRLGIEAIKNTGYQEMTLSSLSTSDYRRLPDLCDSLMDWCEPRSVNLSLPSLRADNFTMDILSRIQKVRHGGVTFAPEAGSQRLRDAINKNVREEELLRSCAVAFRAGWNSVKLYFMLGLPTETDGDVLGIAELAGRVLHTWRENAPRKDRGLRITVSTSCFIPKPHTPFQWESQVTPEEYLRRVALLRENLRAKCMNYNWHDAETSVIEAVLSRGDRRLGRVIEAVWRDGGRMESWTEGFDYSRWLRALEQNGLTAAFYASRERGEGEIMPWEHIGMGVTRAHLLRERRASKESRLSPDCREGCAGCGAAAYLHGGRCDG